MMNNSTVIVFDRYVCLGSFCAVILIAILSFALNGMTIIVLITTKLIKIDLHFFLFNISLADFLFSSVLPIKAVRYWRAYYEDRVYYTDPWACAVLGTMTYSITEISILSMLAISLNHYVRVVHSQMYSQLFRRDITYPLIIFFIWVIPFTLNILPVFGIGAKYYIQISLQCGIQNNSYKTGLYAGLFLIPIILMIYFYTHIFLFFAKHQNRLHQQQNGTVISTIQSNGDCSGNNARIKLIKMMIVICVCFLFSFLPVLIVNVLKNKSTTANIITAVVSFIHSVTNPIVYILMNNKIRSGFLRRSNIVTNFSITTRPNVTPRHNV